MKPNRNDDLCPVCEEGRLIEGVEDNAVDYNGVREVLPYRFSACSKCLIEQTNYEQAQWNKAQMTRLKRRVDADIVATKRPYADPTAKRRSVYLSQEVWEALKKLGKGNASAGIRKAVAQSH